MLYRAVFSASYRQEGGRSLRKGSQAGGYRDGEKRAGGSQESRGEKGDINQ